jgi:hypothetical protein
MRKLSTTLVNNTKGDRKLVTLARNDNEYGVDLETVSNRGRSTFETLADGVDLGTAHYYYIQKILVLNTEGYLIEFAAAYE